MIYLLRHGETVFNAAGRYQGALDSPLTPRGQAQARALGRRLAARLGPAPHGFRLVASPLGRTRETARLVALELGLDPARIEHDARLREVTLGTWDGLTRDEIDAGWPGALDDAGPFEWFYRGPGGESFEQAQARSADWLAEQRADRPVIAISHGAVGRVLRGLYAGLARDITVALDVPQDALFHLADGRIERIEVG